MNYKNYFYIITVMTRHQTAMLIIIIAVVAVHHLLRLHLRLQLLQQQVRLLLPLQQLNQQVTVATVALVVKSVPLRVTLQIQMTATHFTIAYFTVLHI